MSNELREAASDVREFLRTLNQHCDYKGNDRITSKLLKHADALDKALAEPQLELVAWMTPEGNRFVANSVKEVCEERGSRLARQYSVPLYTSPPAPKTLTDDEVYRWFKIHAAQLVCDYDRRDVVALFRAIESKVIGE